jgi:hypothetical protein
MSSTLFLAAAALSALWTVVHLFMGGAQVAGPLRQSRDLPAMVRDTAYLCWHLVSITLAIMAGLLLAAGLGASGAAGLAMAGVALAAGFAAIGILLPLGIGAGYARLPQGWLFVPVAGLGLWGLFL